MPTIITDRDKFKQAIGLRCIVDLDPALTPEEVDQIVDECQLCALWKASTAYTLGDEIIPITENGRVYKCKEAGTSNATEPSWPDFTFADAVTPWPSLVNTRTDSLTLTSAIQFVQEAAPSTVVWEDFGPQPVYLWDLRKAVWMCYDLKVQKSVIRFDQGMYGTSYKFRQTHENLIKQRDSHGPLIV